MDYVGIDPYKKESQICSLLSQDGQLSECRIRTEPQRFAEVLGGPTVLDRLRATRPERHLPVILHSAMSDDELATRRTRLGADGAFRKGGHLLDLVRQLDRLSESA